MMPMLPHKYLGDALVGAVDLREGNNVMILIRKCKYDMQCMPGRAAQSPELTLCYNVINFAGVDLSVNLLKFL